MKKTISKIILSTALTLCIGMGLTGCGGAPTKLKVNAKDVYAFSAITSAGYLSSAHSANSANLKNASFSTTKNASARPDNISDGDIAGVNKFVNMFKGRLLKGGESAPAETKPSVEVDGQVYGLYGIKIETTLPTADGGSNKYVLYYNETALNEEDADVEIDETDNEIEISTSLNGVMLVGSEELKVEGKKTVETENNEVSTEIEFKTIKDENNYVIVKQEVENNEIEYEYSIIENGIQISRTNIEVESDENGKEEIELTFEDIVSGVPSETSYSLENISTATENIFEVKYFNGKDVVDDFKVFVGEISNKYVYNNTFEETI